MRNMCQLLGNTEGQLLKFGIWFLSRSKVNQTPSRSLLQLENVKTRKDTAFYLGKRVAYIYKAKTEKQGSKFRVRLTY